MELGDLEAMVELGALEAMAELEALEAMAELGALEAWRCRELRRPWQVVFGALASVPSAWPPQPEPFLPSPKISLGKSGGIRSLPGLDIQNST